MEVTPYLNFNGRCEEAIEFYRKAVGAEVMALMRFSDNPEACASGQVPPGTEKKVMHSSLQIGKSTVMATDGQCTGKASFEGITLSLSAPDVPASERLFKALGDGGQVHVPLTKTFFSPSFGMVADRFGVTWMVLVAA